MLEKLRAKTGGDEERMQHYIHSYNKTMNTNVRALKEALENEEYHNVGTILHKIKPMFSTMGFESIWKLANHIEMGINRRYSPEMMKEHSLSLIQDIEESVDLLKNL